MSVRRGRQYYLCRASSSPECLYCGVFKSKRIGAELLARGKVRARCLIRETTKTFIKSPKSSKFAVGDDNGKNMLDTEKVTNEAIENSIKKKFKKIPACRENYTMNVSGLYDYYSSLDYINKN